MATDLYPKGGKLEGSSNVDAKQVQNGSCDKLANHVAQALCHFCGSFAAQGILDVHSLRGFGLILHHFYRLTFGRVWRII